MQTYLLTCQIFYLFDIDQRKYYWLRLIVTLYDYTYALIGSTLQSIDNLSTSHISLLAFYQLKKYIEILM